MSIEFGGLAAIASEKQCVYESYVSRNLGHTRRVTSTSHRKVIRSNLTQEYYGVTRISTRQAILYPGPVTVPLPPIGAPPMKAPRLLRAACTAACAAASAAGEILLMGSPTPGFTPDRRRTVGMTPSAGVADPPVSATRRETLPPSSRGT